MEEGQGEEEEDFLQNLRRKVKFNARSKELKIAL